MNTIILFKLFTQAISLKSKITAMRKAETDWTKDFHLKIIEDDAHRRAMRRFKNWSAAVKALEI